MTFLFLVLSVILLLSAVSTIVSKNPIHSVLFLIVVFICSSGILLLLEAEFLGMIFLIIYIGAISVLFLFVIMMLNIRIIELKENILKYAPLTLIIAFVLILEFIYLFNSINSDISVDVNRYENIINLQNLSAPTKTNLELLGYLLYTYYIQFFLICGLILFVAMVGAILLTLEITFSTKKQDLYQQISRDLVRTIKHVKLK